MPAGWSVAPGIIKGALNHVKEMRVDAVADERMAVIVPVNSPGGGCADGVGFPHVSRRMIAPHAALEACTLFLGRAGLAEQRPVGDAVGAVEPAVRAPRKTIGDVVRVCVGAKAIQEHDGFPVWDAVVVLVGYQVKVGDGHHPRPAEAHLDAAYVLELVVKDDSLVVRAVSVGILQDYYPIVLASFFVRIIIGFGHPQTPPVVDAETNRLLDVRFSREKSYLEPLGHLHRLGRLHWRKGFLDDRLRILLGSRSINAINRKSGRIVLIICLPNGL